MQNNFLMTFLNVSVSEKITIGALIGNSSSKYNKNRWG